METEQVQEGYTPDYSQPPLDQYSSLFYPNQYDNRVGLVRELSPRQALLVAIAEFRGEIKDPETNQTTKHIKRVMNEEGISLFYHAVTSAANEINTFSNYRSDEKIIYRLMNKWVFDIVYEFFYNRKKYEIMEESHCSIIVNKAVGLMLPAFFKALGAGDRSAATRAVQETINRAFRDGEGDPVQTQRKGFLSSLNPFSRR